MKKFIHITDNIRYSHDLNIESSSLLIFFISAFSHLWASSLKYLCVRVSACVCNFISFLNAIHTTKFGYRSELFYCYCDCILGEKLKYRPFQKLTENFWWAWENQHFDDAFWYKRNKSIQITFGRFESRALRLLFLFIQIIQWKWNWAANLLWNLWRQFVLLVLLSSVDDHSFIKDSFISFADITKSYEILLIKISENSHTNKDKKSKIKTFTFSTVDLCRSAVYRIRWESFEFCL